MTSPAEQPEEDQLADWNGATVSFRITSHFKHPKGQSGLTQVGSKRLGGADVLNWIINDLPDQVVTLELPEDGKTATVHIDLDLLEKVAPRPPQTGRRR